MLYSHVICSYVYASYSRLTDSSGGWIYTVSLLTGQKAPRMSDYCIAGHHLNCTVSIFNVRSHRPSVVNENLLRVSLMYC